MGAAKPQGVLYRDLPLAGVPTVFGEAAIIAARKLTCALFYKEIGQILPIGQKIVGQWHHLYDPRSINVVDSFNEHMRAYRRPTRGTIKNYGDRLVYKFSYNEDGPLFGIAAQFGRGLFLWCFATNPEAEISSTDPNEVWFIGQPWISNRAAALLERSPIELNRLGFRPRR